MRRDDVHGPSNEADVRLAVLFQRGWYADDQGVRFPGAGEIRSRFQAFCSGVPHALIEIRNDLVAAPDRNPHGEIPHADSLGGAAEPIDGPADAEDQKDRHEGADRRGPGEAHRQPETSQQTRRAA